MGIIIELIVGGLIGWLASRLLGRNEGVVGSVIIGIIGSIIGGAIASAGGSHSYTMFAWSGFVWSLIGALILVAILNAFQHRTHHNI